MDNTLEAIRSDIERLGWHVVMVFSEGDLPDFAYTVGLFQSYGHPEVVMFGAPLNFMHTTLNVLGMSVKQGVTFETESAHEGIIKGHKCRFRVFPRSQYGPYLGCALAFYQGSSFPVLQCFWPDAAGRFPWEQGADTDCVALQPVF